MRGDAFTELEAAREAVLAEAGAFVEELEPTLGESLRAGFQRLLVSQADHATRLDERTRAALERAVADAIRVGVRGVLARLRAPEVWLSPHTAPSLQGRREAGWPVWVPEWAARLLGGGRLQPPGLGDLDDPSNRIWVAIASAATPLDPVLLEFGFRPERRRLGGGSFGIQPKTLPRLDPAGGLARRWRRYRAAYERLAALTREDR